MVLSARTKLPQLVSAVEPVCAPLLPLCCAYRLHTNAHVTEGVSHALEGITHVGKKLIR